MATAPDTHSKENANRLLRGGFFVLRYGLACVLMYAGLVKFTPYQAQNVEKYAANNPLTEWLYSVSDLRTAAKMIGIWEIISGMLIALRSRSPNVSALGSVMAVIEFLALQSFLLTTPGVWQEDRGFPFMSEDPGQFLAKDLLLLGAAIVTLREALDEN